jgi:hypothetical protein
MKFMCLYYMVIANYSTLGVGRGSNNPSQQTSNMLRNINGYHHCGSRHNIQTTDQKFCTLILTQPVPEKYIRKLSLSYVKKL